MSVGAGCGVSVGAGWGVSVGGGGGVEVAGSGVGLGRGVLVGSGVCVGRGVLVGTCVGGSVGSGVSVGIGVSVARGVSVGTGVAVDGGGGTGVSVRSGVTVSVGAGTVVLVASGTSVAVAWRVSVGSRTTGDSVGVEVDGPEGTTVGLGAFVAVASGPAGVAVGDGAAVDVATGGKATDGVAVVVAVAGVDLRGAGVSVGFAGAIAVEGGATAATVGVMDGAAEVDVTTLRGVFDGAASISGMTGVDVAIPVAAAPVAVASGTIGSSRRRITRPCTASWLSSCRGWSRSGAETTVPSGRSFWTSAPRVGRTRYVSAPIVTSATTSATIIGARSDGLRVAEAGRVLAMRECLRAGLSESASHARSRVEP